MFDGNTLMRTVSINPVAFLSHLVLEVLRISLSIFCFSRQRALSIREALSNDCHRWAHDLQCMILQMAQRVWPEKGRHTL